MGNTLKLATRGILIALGIKLIARLLKLCKERNYKDPCKPQPVTDITHASYIKNQLVVWKRPGVTEAEFEEWAKNAIPQGSNIERKKQCLYCDSSMELWEGDNVGTIISEKEAKAGSTAGGGGVTGGGDDVACYTYNLIIDLPEPGPCEFNHNRYEKDLTLPALDGPGLTIAVFDTGLEKNAKDAYTTGVFSCMPGGESGWNFVANNNNTNDDYPSKHGTTVTQFIVDQASKYRKQKINILPVKVHNKFGKSSLFDVLCGFAYAANCGAKIINASFGFYASKGSAAPEILKQFVQKHLTDRNILLVAAAGNLNTNDSFKPAELEEVRNLDLHPFYPACLAKDFKNVLAVTTVSNSAIDTKVSPSQNFSKHIVGVGVVCDQEIDNDYRFRDSLGRQDSAGNTIFIVGSSYATPIVTGMVAQFYPALISNMPGGNINTSVLVQKLKEETPPLVTVNDSLEAFIGGGINCVK